MSIDKYAGPENHPDDSGGGEHERVVSINPLSLKDLPGLRAVLESSVVNPITKEVAQDEVEDLLARYEELISEGGEEKYFVAHNHEGQPVGIMGLAPPDDAIRSFTTTENPIEIVNAYILSTSRGVGVGSHMVRHLEMLAKLGGHTEVVLASGPRYALTGWPFWRKMYGEPAGVAEKYYENEYDAQVWHKEL